MTAKERRLARWRAFERHAARKEMERFIAQQWERSIASFIAENLSWPRESSSARLISEQSHLML